MKLPTFGPALVALALLSTPALAAAPPSPDVPCQLPGSHTATFLSVDEIPAPIKQQLAQYFGSSTGKLELAARNADFRESNFTASSDTSLPYARFVQAGHSGTRWYLWYELRGQRKEFGSLIFDLPTANAVLKIVAAQSVWPATALCPETREHINNAPITAENETWVDLSPGVPCALPGSDTQTLLRMGDLPLPVRRALGSDPTGTKIDLEERDTAYQATDVIDMSQPLLSLRRFIQAGRSGTRWYLWYEEGGMGHSFRIIYFDLPKGADSTSKVRRYDGLPVVGTLCSDTLKLWDQKW